MPPCAAHTCARMLLHTSMPLLMLFTPFPPSLPGLRPLIYRDPAQALPFLGNFPEIQTGLGTPLLFLQLI